MNDENQPEAIVRLLASGYEGYVDDSTIATTRISTTVQYLANRQGFRHAAAQVRVFGEAKSSSRYGMLCFDYTRSEFSAELSLRMDHLTLDNCTEMLARFHKRQRSCVSQWYPEFEERAQVLLKTSVNQGSRFRAERADDPGDSPLDDAVMHGVDESALDELQSMLRAEEPCLVFSIHPITKEPLHSVHEVGGAPDGELIAIPMVHILGNRQGFRYLAAGFEEVAEQFWVLGNDQSHDPDDHGHLEFDVPHEFHGGRLSVLGEFRFGILTDENRSAVFNEYGIESGDQHGCLTRWMPAWVARSSATYLRNSESASKDG